MDTAVNKRQRGSDTPQLQSVVPQPSIQSAWWVYWAPFDTPSELVLVDTRLLADFQCRSYKRIQYDTPDDWHNGRSVWYVTAKRGVVEAFLSALVHHEFVVPEGVNYYEVVRFLRYEGVTFPTTHADGVLSYTGAPKRYVVGYPPPSIAGMRELMVGFDYVRKTARQIADALHEWPRLYFALTAAAVGKDVSVDAAPTRVWVQFATAPQAKWTSHLTTDSAAIENVHIDGLLLTKPRWFKKTLCGIAMKHHELVREEEEGFVYAPHEGRPLAPSYFSNVSDEILHDLAIAAVRVCNDPANGYVHEPRWASLGEVPLLLNRYSVSSAAADLLEYETINDSLGPFFATRGDIPHHERGNVDAYGKGRHHFRHRRRFCTAVLATTGFHHEASSQSKETQLAKGCQWDRAFSRRCVALAQRMRCDMPDCARLFGPVCGTLTYDKGGRAIVNTPERRILHECFLAHRMRIVEWRDDGSIHDPLVFPSTFHVASVHEAPLATPPPCFLLEIDVDEPSSTTVHPCH